MGAILSCSKSNGDVIEGVTPLCPEDEEIEGFVCNEDDLPEEGMKSFPLGEGTVLLVRHNGELSALGSKCSHYGAPLEKGVLGTDGTIRCPWHGACFDSETGDIEDFPGLDSLPCYTVSFEEGDSGEESRRVHVRARRSQLLGNKRVLPLAGKDETSEDTIVVVGGGGAGSSCVEALRQIGFTGRLVLVCGEHRLPYDRPKLSKNMAAQQDVLALRSKDYYESGGIEVLLGTTVLAVDTEQRVLLLDGGNSLCYTGLFLATGGAPRTLSCPGASLLGVQVLRDPDDAAALLKQAHEQHVVIVGSSFIGMEAAAHLSSLNVCRSVSVVGSSAVPYLRSLGSVVGARLMQMMQEAGVGFYMQDQVLEIRGNGRVEEVVLESGTVLPAGIVLCGIGVAPSTSYLEEAGIDVDRQGHVLVDEHLETSVPGVYCGGDIAAFPLHYGGQLREERVALGHWQVAQYHGHLAAHNLAVTMGVEGERRTFSSVPIFWTVLLGKSLRYAGYCTSPDDVLITGDLNSLSFTAHYLSGDSVVAVAAMQRDPAVMKYAELLREGRELTRDMVEQDGDLLLK